MKLVLISLIVFLLITISADIYSESDLYGVPKESVTSEIITNNYNYFNTTNTTDLWYTNIGSLDDVNDTQFNNNDNFLTIDLSWLTDFFNNLFSSKDTDDLTEGSINLYDNQSWNQPLADSLYSGGGSNYTPSMDLSLNIKSSKNNDVYWNIADSDTNDVNIIVEGQQINVFGDEVK